MYPSTHIWYTERHMCTCKCTETDAQRHACTYAHIIEHFDMLYAYRRLLHLAQTLEGRAGTRSTKGTRQGPTLQPGTVTTRTHTPHPHASVESPVQ